MNTHWNSTPIWTIKRYRKKTFLFGMWRTVGSLFVSFLNVQYHKNRFHMTIELVTLNSSKEMFWNDFQTKNLNFRFWNHRNHMNVVKEYAMKSDFMKRSLKTLQKNIILGVIKCGIIGYLAWRAYETNGEWLKLKLFSMISHNTWNTNIYSNCYHFGLFYLVVQQKISYDWRLFLFTNSYACQGATTFVATFAILLCNWSFWFVTLKSTSGAS